MYDSLCPTREPGAAVSTARAVEFPTTMVVDGQAKIVCCPEQPELVGATPWVHVDEVQAIEYLQKIFVDACMFRQRLEGRRLTVRGEALELCLVPFGEVFVLCWVTHRVKGPFLSLREQQVLDLVEAGESNDAIANRLQVHGATIRSHLKNIRDKLGVVRPEAVLFAAHGHQLKSLAEVVAESTAEESTARRLPR